MSEQKEIAVIPREINEECTEAYVELVGIELTVTLPMLTQNLPSSKADADCGEIAMSSFSKADADCEEFAMSSFSKADADCEEFAMSSFSKADCPINKVRWVPNVGQSLLRGTMVEIGGIPYSYTSYCPTCGKTYTLEPNYGATFENSPIQCPECINSADSAEFSHFSSEYMLKAIWDDIRITPEDARDAYSR